MKTVTTLAAIIATAVLGGLSAPATQAVAAASGGGQCFYISQLNGFRADGMRTVYARVGAGTILRFDMKNDCPDLASTPEGIVLAPTPTGSICGPMDLDLSIHSHGTTSRCLVDSIVKLTPEEAAALPAKARP